MGKRRINDVYMICDPWAPQTLVSLMAADVSRTTRVQAYHQGAQGVRYNHSRGMIHRDLKPANILVARRDPLHVVISDFGHATTAPDSQDYMKGTIVYLPPEIIQLKRLSKDRLTKDGTSNSLPNLHWSDKSDVFSYGVVGFELLHEACPRSLEGIDEDVQRRLLETLRKSRTEIDGVLEDMLAWAPDSRPEMRQVLLRPCWSDPETPFTAKKRFFPGF